MWKQPITLSDLEVCEIASEEGGEVDNNKAMLTPITELPNFKNVETLHRLAKATPTGTRTAAHIRLINAIAIRNSI